MLAAVLAVALAPVAARAADDDNPYKNAKVGDYATYKMTTKVAGFDVAGTMTQTVTAKNDKEATVKVTGPDVNGMDLPAQEQTIDLTKPFDPTKASGLPAGHRRQGREGQGRQGEDQGRRQGVRQHLDDLQGEGQGQWARISTPT